MTILAGKGGDISASATVKAMLSTILRLHHPLHLAPAQQQPDDSKLVMDRHVFYDEPEMQAVISSFDEPIHLQWNAAGTRAHSHLPVFPAHFCVWDPDSEIWLDNHVCCPY